mmetsp:Transcript_9492/g.30170  ORF Transcript_9492/g.30170 Transcript_9492/m.30170 type:complete len:293 (-) Transcript_9492:186-1064(-)
MDQGRVLERRDLPRPGEERVLRVVHDGQRHRRGHRLDVLDVELGLDARDGQVPSDGLLDRDVNLAALAKRGQVGRLVVLPLVLGHRHRARRAAARGGGGDLVPHRQHCGRDKVVALRRRAPLWPFLAGGGGEGGGFGRVGGRLLGDVRELDQLADERNVLSHRCVERVPCGSAQQPRRSLDAGVAVPVEASGEQRLRLRRRHHDGEHVAVWRDGHLGAGGGEVMRRGGDALVAHVEQRGHLVVGEVLAVLRVARGRDRPKGRLEPLQRLALDAERDGEGNARLRARPLLAEP